MNGKDVFGIILFVLILIIAIAVVGSIIDSAIREQSCMDFNFDKGYWYTWREGGEVYTDYFCVRGAVFGEPEIYPLDWVKENCNSVGECRDG